MRIQYEKTSVIHDRDFRRHQLGRGTSAAPPAVTRTAPTTTEHTRSANCPGATAGNSWTSEYAGAGSRTESQQSRRTEHSVAAAANAGWTEWSGPQNSRPATGPRVARTASGCSGPPAHHSWFAECSGAATALTGKSDEPRATAWTCSAGSDTAAATAASSGLLNESRLAERAVFGVRYSIFCLSLSASS